MSSLHALFEFTELVLPRQELPSLFVDFSLHPQLDFPQFLFLMSELLLSDYDGLVGKVFGIYCSILSTADQGISRRPNGF